MMKKKLLVSSLSVFTLFGAGMLFTTDLFESQEEVTPKYQERTTRFVNQNTGATDMQELLFELRKNVVTGQLSREDYQLVLNQLQQMSSPRNAILQWEELGPDNIGGRTRAIVVDNTDQSIIYAGAVSGGLWKSENNGNNWSQVLAFSENLGVSHMAQTPDGTLYIGTGHFQEGSFGSEGSGYNGNGLYYTTDGGATIVQVAGTENYGIHKLAADTINNRIFMATDQGLKSYTAGGTVDNVNVSGSNSFTSAVEITKDGTVIVTVQNSRVYVSKDGGNTFSNRADAGLANPITSADVGRVEFAISDGLNDNGQYSIYASMCNSSGRIRGVWISENSGDDWYEIAPSYQQQTQGGLQPVFAPFSTSLSSQGFYNNIITVNPNNPDRVYLGGIDVYDWVKAVGNPPFGSWEQSSFWFLSPTSPQYVHADVHEFTWAPNGRLYIGSDGGIGVSDDFGESFFPANRGYNVTQFYSLAFSADGDVMGGTQDNGTLLNDFTMQSWQEFRQVRGGDGFQCEIGFRNKDILFATIYYGGVTRSDDRGETWSNFFNADILALGDPGQTLGSFFTAIEKHENPFDLNSTDTVKFVPARPYSSGEEVVVSSFSTGDTLVTTLTQDIRYDDTAYYDPALTETDTIVQYNDSLFINLDANTYSFIFGSHPITAGDSILVNGTDTVVVDSYNTFNHYFISNNGDIIDIGNDTVLFNVAWDTIKVQDIRQSWFAFGLSGSNGVWITREALRFQSAPDWYKVADQYSGRVITMEFSKDDEHLYIGTSGGELWRVSGFNDVYASTPRDSISKWIDLSENVAYPTKSKLTQTRIMTASGPITGIYTDPQDAERVMVTIGGFGGSGKVRLSTTAASATTTSGFGSFQDRQGNIPSMPMYSCIIDRDNPDFGVVGTEFGVWATENLSSPNPTWIECNDLMGRVPVFEMGQAWRPFSEGAKRPGEIYIATHGRGMFKSATLLNVPDFDEEEEDLTIKDQLKVFPNPLRSNATIEFDLKTSSDVMIKVYNLSGRVVKQINKDDLNAGNHQISFNASDLPNGTYIIQMQAGVSSKTAKFIKTR
jgi:hypothetical protein